MLLLCHTGEEGPAARGKQSMDGKGNVREKIRLKYKVMTKATNTELHGMLA